MTFCGDWAGSVFSSDPACSNKGSCTSWVQNNPGAFAPSYWSVLNLKVYQNNGQNGDVKVKVPAGETAGAGRFAAENATQTAEEVRLCQKMGLCLEDGEKLGEQMRYRGKRAAASQIAPSKVPKASQTVNSASAAASASAEPDKVKLADAVGWA